MIDVVCFVGACNIIVWSTLGCAGTIDVVGFKFVANFVAKRSKSRIISLPSCNAGGEGVGFLMA